VCFKSRVKKRRSNWWWQRWRWQCGSDQCRVLRRWNTRMWMRHTERMREFIPKAGCCMLKKTVCNFEIWESRWSKYCDNRRGSSSGRRLNSDQLSLRYVGWEVPVVRTLLVRERSLYSMCSLTFNQCRDLITGVMCENLGDLTTLRASLGFVEVDLSENLVDWSIMNLRSQVWSEW